LISDQTRHPYIGIHRVHSVYTPTGLFTFQLSVPTSAYPGHCPRPWLLGESSSDEHLVGTYSDRLRAPSDFPRSCGSFGVSLGVRLSTGFHGGEPWSTNQLPGPYPVPFWASPSVRVGLSAITMVQSPVRVPTHRYRLAGIPGRTPSDPRLIPPHGLMTSRYRGDDAFLRSQEVGDCTQHRTTSYQGAQFDQTVSLAPHPPVM
jgi:hypothetical protein